MSITCNENVNCEWSYDYAYGSVYRFYPNEGYALWRDNEEGNLDEETGEPMCYWHQILTDKPEEYALHIWAKLIDETMIDYTPQQVSNSDIMTLGLDDDNGNNSQITKKIPSTYIDENGIERDKRGIY